MLPWQMAGMKIVLDFFLFKVLNFMVLLSVLVNYNIRYNCWSVLCKMSIPLPMQSNEKSQFI